MSRRSDWYRRRVMAEYRRCMAVVRDPVRDAEHRGKALKCAEESKMHGLQAQWLRRTWR